MEKEMLANTVGKRKFVFLLPLLSITFLFNSQIAWSFKVSNHEAITDEQLQSSECNFGVYSTDEVSDANFYTDIFESENLSAHVDDNWLDLGSKRLKSKREDI